MGVLRPFFRFFATGRPRKRPFSTMFLHLRLPKTILWVFNLLMIFLLMFTTYRLVTLLAFLPEGEPVKDLFNAFFLGLRYDLRWISIILMPIIIASLIPQLSP